VTRVVSLNPATNTERALEIDETSPQDVAVLCARASSIAAQYGAWPLSRRAEMLRTMAAELEADAASLVEVAMEETSLPRARLEGELRRTAYQLRFFADVVVEGSFLQASIDHATNSPMGPLADLRRMKTPLGPVAVFGSSNFPFAFSVPGGDTVSALAAGCPVVIKAHPAHPATSQATFDALERGAKIAGAPEGVLGLVFGFDSGVALVDDPSIRAVGFTGSGPVGKALWARANARPTPIPFFGELGAANPLVVTAAAAAERAETIGAGVAGSMTLGVGQFCTKPGIVLVPNGEHGDALVEALVGALRELHEMTMLAPGIARHFRDGATSIAESAGTRRLVGGDAEVGSQARAQLFEVSAITFVEPSSRPLREECFGPLAVVVRYDDNEQIRQALDIIDPSLTFSVFAAADDPDATWLIALGASKAGRVTFNEYPTGVGVSWSMQHGGPWPSTTSPATTSVGASGIERWLRPITFQGIPMDLLPEALKDDNPLGIPQRIDGNYPG